jgi:hypothetical protein
MSLGDKISIDYFYYSTNGYLMEYVQGAEFGTPDTNFLVRAERSGSGDCVYTVNYKSNDNVGNTVTTTQDIVVKQDNSKK